LKAAYEKTTGQKAVFIRRTDGESLAQIRAEKANPRADVYHAAESASAKQLASEGLLEAYKSPRVARAQASAIMADYARWLETAQALISGLSVAERGQVMGGSAVRFYKLV
jgi:ABC-type Fe3+ transport system substrate-binding protein